MELKLWKGFKKRRNSTKRPTGGTTYTVILKQDTSILAPHFIMSDPEINYNYCKFNDRYYYIEDTISLANGLIELVCKSDPLASGKDDITNSVQYVLRAASHNERMIPDTACNPPTESVECAHTDIFNLRTNGFLDYDTTAHTQKFSYILQASGKNNGATFFQLDDYLLGRLYDKVFDPSVWSQAQNQLNDLKNCLLSLKKIPYVISARNPSNIWLGTEDPGCIGYKIETDERYTLNTGGVTINYPSESHAETKSYLDFEPYSYATLHLPFVGIVPLPLDVIGDQRRINIKMTCDLSTGDIVYDIDAAGGGAVDVPVARYSANCATDVPICGQTYNSIGMLANGISVAAGVATALAGNPMGIMQAGMGAIGMTQSAGRNTYINGKYSSAIGCFIDTACYVDIVTKEPVNWDVFYNRDIAGVPVNRSMALNTTGYVQTMNANVETALTETEKQQIDGALDSGIYIE